MAVVYKNRTKELKLNIRIWLIRAFGAVVLFCFVLMSDYLKFHSVGGGDKNRKGHVVLFFLFSVRLVC